MNILFVAATKEEVNLLEKHFLLIDEEDKNLKHYSCNNHFIDVLITGIGMISTAYWTTKTLANKKYDLAINLGVAGSFDKNLQVGEVVNIEEDMFSELGAEDGKNFLSLSQLNLPGEDEFPYKNGILFNSSTIENNAVNLLPKVKGITVNTVHGNDESILKVVDRFSPQTESMEGAAFFHVCLLEKIPCLQVRAISNYVEKRDREKWNLMLAIENLNKKSIEIVNHL